LNDFTYRENLVAELALELANELEQRNKACNDYAATIYKQAAEIERVQLEFANAQLHWSQERDELKRQMEELKGGHCSDCCCARSWKALGISEYTGKSIPEHIYTIVGMRHNIHGAIIEQNQRDLAVWNAAIEKAAELCDAESPPYDCITCRMVVKEAILNLKQKETI
jgi:hypothetical protein